MFFFRFGNLFEDFECVLAAATNPKYKLSRWVDWLPGVDGEKLRNRTKQHLISIMKNHHESDEQYRGSSIDARAQNSDADAEILLMHGLYDSPEKEPNENLILRFLSESPSRCFDSTSFRSDRLKELFLKYNTPIPSSAAVERLFSTAKDVLKPKRNRLTDRHFEMLLFLRKNKTA